MKRILLAAIFAVFSAPVHAAATDAGKYQVILGDCEGCHGKNLAGGVSLETPFGKMVAPNITPDKETGIGNYTAADFWLAMKRGVAPGGRWLYPAMPYPSYAKLTDADVKALYDFFMKDVPAVHQANKPNEIPAWLSFRSPR